MERITGLILFGESVVAGRGVRDRNMSFGRLLKKRLSIPVLIKGKSFITSEDALGRLEKEVLRKDCVYSHVLVFVGNNDPRLVGYNTPKFTVTQFKNNMKEIISRVQQSDRNVMLTNLQPLQNDDIHRIHPAMPKFLKPPITPYEWHKKYSDACKEIAEEMKIPFVDIRTPLEKSKNEVIADYCLDPNAHGHSIIAQTIFNKIKIDYCTT